MPCCCKDSPLLWAVGDAPRKLHAFRTKRFIWYACNLHALCHCSCGYYSINGSEIIRSQISNSEHILYGSDCDMGKHVETVMECCTLLCPSACVSLRSCLSLVAAEGSCWCRCSGERMSTSQLAALDALFTKSHCWKTSPGVQFLPTSTPSILGPRVQSGLTAVEKKLRSRPVAGIGHSYYLLSSVPVVKGCVL